MRELKNDKGKIIGVSMNDEPKIKRPGPEPITTRNTPVKPRAKAEAERGSK